MTDKLQKIREEVERLRNIHQIKYQNLDTNDNMCLVECGKRNLCNELLSFIDSLQEEPVSEDLEDAAKNHAIERYKATRDMVLAEKCKWSFKAGAEWNFERIKEALLSEVLPCFMHGGEADEVVAKLDEVLNKKK